MNFNNYNESEPDTYTLLKEKLEISSNEFEKKLYEKNIDAHTQIKQASMYAKRLEIFIKILNNKLNKNGFLIFEQIKNQKDLFNNLSKLSIKYKIFFLLPASFGTNEILNNFCFKSSIFQFFLRILYVILGKKINHFILIHKS